MITLRRWQLGAIVSSALLLAACGGGSSSENNSGGTGGSRTSVSGIVTDPPVSGASVRLLGPGGGALAAIVQTDDNGRFTLTATGSISGAVLYANGGNDRLTGQQLFGIELSAPLGDEGSAYVSPLSTLVSEEMKASPVSRSTAANTVASRLGLSAAAVLGNPADSGLAQLTALKLTRIAVALRNAGTPFTRIATALRSSGNLDTTLAALTADSTLSQSVREQLTATAEEITALNAIGSNANASAVIAAANRSAWQIGTLRYLKDALAFTPGNDDQRANINALADALWQANGQRGVPANGVQVRNLVRYAFQRYGISVATLSSTPFTLPSGLSSDAQVPALSRLTVLDHTLPLAAGEELGNNNLNRLNYFYASDLSPFYRAEQLFTDIFDDLVLDPLYSDIAAGLAAIGHMDEANTILQARIFQPTARADAKRRIALGLAKRGLLSEAESLWRSALREHEAIIRTRGLETLTADEATFYNAISQSASEYGLTALGNESVVLVQDYIQSNLGQPYSTAYGRLLVAFASNSSAAVDAAEAAGMTASSKQAALTKVETLDRFVRGTGYQTTTACSGVSDNKHYKLKTLYLTDTANYYIRLGETAKARALANHFEEVRADNTAYACNKSQTDIYMKYMAPVYAALGQVPEYIALVDATVTNASYVADSKNAISTFQAIEEAKAGDMTTALNRIASNNPSDLKARLEQLTNLGLNRNSPRLALALFNAGQTARGKQALDSAWTVATSSEYSTAYASSPSSMIQSGCAKLARLYHDYVAVSSGQDKMSECATLASNTFASSTNSNRFYSFLYLAQTQALTNQKAAARINAGQAASLINSETSASTRNSLRRTLSLTMMDLDMQSEALALFSDALTEYSGLISAASTDTLRRTAIDDGISTANYLNQLITSAQGRAVSQGSLSPEEQLLIKNARGMVSEISQGNSSRVSNGLSSATASLSSASDRATRYKKIVPELARARYYDKAEAMARLAGNSLADKQIMLQSIASNISVENDFGGSTLASRDLDGDGRPDFFELTASPLNIANSTLQLDDDIDGDGIPDASDKTPFCALCTF